MKLKLAVVLVALLGVFPDTPRPAFTDWSPPVNLGPVVNSRYLDSCAAISKNGLSLFFSSDRQAPSQSGANRDLYVSNRPSVDGDWEAPLPLTNLNTALAWESCPALSLDEHRLYFTSPRVGTCGGQDMWVSRRHDRRDDFGWEPPVNLGCAAGGPNSAANDIAPALFEDEGGRVVMYFASNRSGNLDHFQSVMNDDDTFGPATPIAELNSPYDDAGITVRRDGLEVIFLSKRPGGGGSAAMNLFDFWSSTRDSTSDPWSPPVFVESLGKPAWAQGKIALSFDGRELYFTSWNQPSTGGTDRPDIWVATREKVGGKKK